MINLFYVSTEIFLSLSILSLLLIGVFKKKSESFIYNFSCIILLVGLAININLNPQSPIDLFNNSYKICLLYTSPSPRDSSKSRMPSSA